MSSLSFQDAFFLRAESASTQAHVAALMTFTLPRDVPADYMRRLATKLGRLNTLWPVLNRKLQDPGSTRSPAWVAADDYDPHSHVFHHALPAPGRMSDLMRLIEFVHEPLLDRARPLWQLHLIEGLKGGRFALYFKVHHSVIDGVGGLRLVQGMLSDNPKCRTLGAAGKMRPRKPHDKSTVIGALADAVAALRKQSRALPEALSVFARLGWESLLGNKDGPLPPFAAPRTIINGEISARRRIIICELPIRRVRAIGRHYGGTINDVLVAVCGSALREYLLSQKALPRQSLDAGLPVSMKSGDGSEGNQLGLFVCPFATDQRNPVKRLRRVIRATTKAKSEIDHLSPAATEDLATIVMLPFLVMSLTHTSQTLPPVFNTIVSNMPGPRQPLYLDGSRLERIYPVSVITDGLGLNITMISYRSKLCIALTSCPGGCPGIESLGDLIQDGYRELLATISD